MSVLDNIKAGEYETKLPYPNGLVKDSGWTQNKKTMRDEYREDNRRLQDVFKKDLEEEFILGHHQKRHLLFNIAWNDAHSHGLQEVFYKYEEMAPLLF